jgi:hypothetical protein
MYVILCKELLSMHPEFMIPVRGDSMRDAGIVTGDIVRVVADVTLNDGDIVLACIDGEYTLKSYCEDEEGQHWLVPQNDTYSPILLDGKTNVRIYGRVKEIVKTAPRVAYRKCMEVIRKMKKTKETANDERAITPQQVSEAIAAVAPMIVTGRQWYAVYRPLVDLRKVDKGDYEGFCQLVRSIVPDHAHLPTAQEMQRMAVQSFDKPVPLWNERNAPVTGKRFKSYLSIANKVKSYLSAA